MGSMDEKTNNTRQRVLEAAGEVFAEKGFARATIREIVDRADANLNAVNYYFRDKEGLYLAVFEYAHEFVAEEDRVKFDAFSTLPADERLRAIIEHLVRSYFARKRKAWHPKLMMREMNQPTGAMDHIVQHMIRPRFEAIVSAVEEIAGTEDGPVRARLCAQSIVGQCIHFSHARSIISRLIPEITYDQDSIEAIIRHITHFSLASLQSLSVKEPLE